MVRRIKLFLARTSGTLPPRWRGVLLNIAEFLFFKILRPTRDHFLRHLVRRLPIPAAVRPPEKLWDSTEDFCRSAGLADSYHPIHEASDIDRVPAPLTISESLHRSFITEKNHVAPRTFVSVIPFAQVFGDCGAVISPDKRLIADVSLEIGAKGFSHSIFSRFRLPKVKYLEGNSTVLATVGRSNYFHWMFDCLPRLELLRLADIRWDEIDHFLVGEFTQFQKDSLEILGIDPTRRVHLASAGHFRCENLLLPSLPGNTGNPPAWVCRFLRQKFLDNSNSTRCFSGRKIYVSREGASFRRVLNEKEVISILEPEGFEVVRLETLNIREQAEIFAQSDVIVSPHGAGLTNLVFCRPATQVVEIFSPRCVLAPYWAISSHGSLRYSYLLGEPMMTDANGGYFTMIEDIQVDCEKLLKTLDLCARTKMPVDQTLTPDREP